ncbi:MAG: alkaline phosphatase family protein [Bacteroidales bacterium]|nr:alkaline phosphatase family protein [Bacteroidales bacterium]
MKISRRSFVKTGLAASAALAATSLLGTACTPAVPGKKVKAKRVIIFTFDGIRVDGLAQANTPNIDSLIATGSASFLTRDVMPSITLPNYTSHLLGAGPEVHGVVDNSWTMDNIKLPAVETDQDGYFPSVFKVLHDAGIKTAYYWNWLPLINPINQKWLDDKLSSEENDYATLCDRAMEFIAANRDQKMFMFLYDVWTDVMGHRHQWMSPEYIKSIEDDDAQVGRVIDFLKKEGLYEDSHLMFISDHGGIGYGHGGTTPEEMTVPWIISGPGIKKGFTIEESNNTVNTASTVLRLFGLDQPLAWTGEVPTSIFE